MFKLSEFDATNIYRNVPQIMYPDIYRNVLQFMYTEMLRCLVCTYNLKYIDIIVEILENSGF